MATFNFTVDTSEMADSIHAVAPHVDGTTVAVVAMQAAVLLAEKQAAEKICKNVNEGFFGLIRSQISQKLAVCRSQMDARVMELSQQSQELSGVKGRMERDFQMISVRYAKLFRSLDTALFSRINELDKPLLTFIKKGADQAQKRIQAGQASVPIHQSETVSSSQVLAVAQTKASTARALEYMRRFVGESNGQKTLVESMLEDARGGAGGSVHLPVAFMEADHLRTRQPQWQFHYPPTPAELTRKLSAGLEGQVMAAGQGLNWEAPAAGAKASVTVIFEKMVKESQASERVRALMLKLSDASHWKALQRTQA